MCTVQYVSIENFMYRLDLLYSMQRPMMYGVMIGGWTLGLYFLQMLWEHLNVILIAYQAYVFWYVIATGFVSFVICYRMGPPKNQRSKDLIKWGLQLMANIMIFYSSNYREASVSIMIAAIFWQYFPVSTTSIVRRFWLVISAGNSSFQFGIFVTNSFF